jgi:ubiquinone/menaquinone biosynthesis C-methylase UbiE
MRIMPQKYSLEEIRDFWAEQARLHGQAAAASWSDIRVMEMEVREISRYLADGDRVLDVGCANGYSTVQFAAGRDIQIRGVDYIPEMVEQARQRLGGMADRLRGRVEFASGDITALDEPNAAYDKVITIRVLINLGAWEFQLKGLRECARVLKPGGTLLTSEATVRGWVNLNRFRHEWGLPDIPMPPFNQYLDEQKLLADLPADLRLVEVVDFASTYYVGTRVLKPLLVQALESGVDAADPRMEWNRWFSQLPPAGDYGTQKLFVFQKQ